MSRYFLVECHTGRIWGEPAECSAPVCHVGLARGLDERLGRHGRTYVGHLRSPSPGVTTGYYVYRVAYDDTTRDVTDAPERIWECVGFVEVIADAAERVWIEPHAAGYVVCSTRDDELLTISPVPLADAERIAQEFAQRTGACLVSTQDARARAEAGSA